MDPGVATHYTLRDCQIDKPPAPDTYAAKPAAADTAAVAADDTAANVAAADDAAATATATATAAAAAADDDDDDDDDDADADAATATAAATADYDDTTTAAATDAAATAAYAATTTAAATATTAATAADAAATADDATSTADTADATATADAVDTATDAATTADIAANATAATDADATAAWQPILNCSPWPQPCKSIKIIRTHSSATQIYDLWYSPNGLVGSRHSIPPTHLSSAALLVDTPDTDAASLAHLDLGHRPLHTGGVRQPPPSVWDCLVSCHNSMGQSLARKRVEQGVRLYNQQKHVAAVKKWKQAMRRIRKDNDCFITLGYLAQANMDWGRYRELLDFGFQQLDIANELDSPMLRADAYLTLARGNEKLGNLEKTVSYCRHSLYNQCDQSRTTGQVHLTLGSTYAVYSSFTKAIEHYELALKVSRSIRDTALELQVYCGLGYTFCLLQDFEKALSFSAKAFELAKTFQILELNSKYQRLSLLTLATPLRKLGRLHEARDCCQDALKLALTAGDRPSHARCLTILGDIHRQCLDVQRAFKRYEASMQLMKNMEDKYGQLIALNGISKTLGLMRRQSKICDCRPLDINNKVIDQASALGCKLLMRSAHIRLAEIYRILNDKENDQLQERLAACLTEEMELVCGVCGDRYGDQGGNSLDALPCSHIFHAKCVRDLMAQDRKKKKRICPDCRKSLNSRLMLICYDELKAAYGNEGGMRFPRYHSSPSPDDQPL
ncbi:unnamed protein product, partial [Meganyctiphanes norvegica]